MGVGREGIGEFYVGFELFGGERCWTRFRFTSDDVSCRDPVEVDFFVSVVPEGHIDPLQQERLRVLGCKDSIGE